MVDRPASPFARPAVLFICALTACGLWGSAIPAIKLVYRVFGVDTSNVGSLLLFAGVRFALAGFLVLLFFGIHTRKAPLPDKRDWGKVLVIAAFQTVIQYLCYYIGLANTTGVTAAIVVGTNSFFTILLATLVFRTERLTAMKAVGCLTGFFGVVAAQLGKGAQLAFTLKGEGLILLSAVSAALSAVLISRYSRRVSPVTISGWQFLLGGAVLAAAGAALGGHWELTAPEGVAALLYLALVSAVAYTLWSLLLQHNPVSRVTVFGFLTPVFGVVLSAALLGESNIGAQVLLGLILVCAGIFLVNFRKNAQ